MPIIIGALIGFLIGGVVGGAPFGPIGSLFGSIVALGAYGWLLREVGAGPVSTYAFVNPLVAVLFGHLALSETLSPGALLSGALVVAAVALVLLGRFVGDLGGLSHSAAGSTGR